MQRVSSCQNKIKRSDSYKELRQPQSVNLQTWAVFIYLAMINIKKCAIISPDQKTRRFLFLWSLFFLNFIIIATFYSCTSYLNICRSFECMYECDIKDLIRFGINYNKVRWNLGFFCPFFSIDLFNPNLFYISKHRCNFCSRLVFSQKLWYVFL